MENQEYKFDSRIMSSSHINFLFGAGINGTAFPQLKEFKETIELLETELGRKYSNFEADLATLSEAKQEPIFKNFVKEFADADKNLDTNHESIKDIERLFQATNKLILESENRTTTTKQVNIYTLNYDGIVENALSKIGVLNNVVSSSNIDSHDKFFDLVGYNYISKRYIPTYLVSKIHGDITNPILPSRKKYDETLEAKRFEILFKMKAQLSRINSLLIVIGYSGRDNHINRLIKDCVASGLTIYWFKYKESDSIPVELADRVQVVNQPNQDELINVSKICANMLEVLWEEQSVE